MKRLFVALMTVLVCSPSYLGATEVGRDPITDQTTVRGTIVTATGTEVISGGHLMIEATDKVILRAHPEGSFKVRLGGRLNVSMVDNLPPTSVNDPAPEKTGFYTVAEDGQLSIPVEAPLPRTGALRVPTQ